MNQIDSQQIECIDLDDSGGESELTSRDNDGDDEEPPKKILKSVASSDDQNNDDIIKGQHNEPLTSDVTDETAQFDPNDIGVDPNDIATLEDEENARQTKNDCTNTLTMECECFDDTTTIESDLINDNKARNLNIHNKDLFNNEFKYEIVNLLNTLLKPHVEMFNVEIENFKGQKCKLISRYKELRNEANDRKLDLQIIKRSHNRPKNTLKTFADKQIQINLSKTDFRLKIPNVPSTVASSLPSPLTLPNVTVSNGVSLLVQQLSKPSKTVNVQPINGTPLINHKIEHPTIGVKNNTFNTNIKNGNNVKNGYSKELQNALNKPIKSFIINQKNDVINSKVKSHDSLSNINKIIPPKNLQPNATPSTSSMTSSLSTTVKIPKELEIVTLESDEETEEKQLTKTEEKMPQNNDESDKSHESGQSAQENGTKLSQMLYKPINLPKGAKNNSDLPVPHLDIELKDQKDVVLKWSLRNGDDEKCLEKIKEYQIYMSKENDPNNWSQIGNVKALNPPMACTLNNLLPEKYFFCVRSIDFDNCNGKFSNVNFVTIK